jgi:MGT family glycosyltransferase
MHYLLATWDGGGTVPIDFGIARRLAAHGHTITVLGDPTIAEEADRAGAEFVPWRNAPHRRSTALEDDVLKDWECRNQLELFRRVADRLITGPAAAYAVETAAELARRPPDVAVVDAAILGPMVAAEALRVPTVAICPGIYIMPAKGMPPFGLGLKPARGRPGRLRDTAINAAVKAAWRSGLPALNAARAGYGLSALADPWDQLRSCHSMLIASARSFDFPAQLPDFAQYVGPILDDPIWAAESIEFGSEEDLPLVVVGLSSTFVAGQDDLLRRIIAALATLRVRGLVCTGPTIDPAEVPGAGQVRVVRSAPHSEVFPLARVVVTHGGHGTMMKALAAGKPVLCLPGFRDQKDNAARMTTRGAGLSLKTTASSAHIAAAVQRLIDEPGFVTAAVDLGRRIRAEIDRTALISLLERPGSERKVG